VVWRIGPDAPRDTAADSADARARRRLRRRDPEDVPAVRAFPRPRTPAAVLLAANGATYREPRFFADGRRVLVSRADLTSDDVVRPDLYVWDTRTGRVTRATRGAAVRDADPSPVGRAAAGVRCAGGRCDLVRLDLRSGASDHARHGSPGRRGRAALVARRFASSPAGSAPAVALALTRPTRSVDEIASPTARRDDARRSRPTGARLVYTSKRGGRPTSCA
jgi:hypothetical protein